MVKSPPMEIRGRDPEANARPQLVYLASLFRATMQANSFATLELMGTSGYYLDQISQALEKLHVPQPKIVPIVLSSSPAAIPPFGYNPPVPISGVEQRASIYIDYGAVGKQRVTVEFKPDEKSIPIEVEFEVEPDGTMLKEVKAEWATPLKIVVANSAGMGVGKVKFATKIVGLAGFDRKTVNNIETELKAKLKQALSIHLKTIGKIEFYGAIGVKYADEKFKPVAEAGVLFEIPFDLADLLK